MCRVLQISRSAWCEWNRREPEREEKRHARERLVEEIRKIHEESGRVYGSPRILQALKGTGVDCAKHHVERIMREEGIRAETKRKKIRTTDSRHGYSIVPNILNRNFESSEPNRKWVSDITYIATGEGWLYLAAIMDLASRSIVGWATSANIDTALVKKALDRAVANRKPPVGLILHSDRGSQYASYEYRKALWRNGIICSMSRKGNCWDNAPMESFFGTLKTECVHRRNYRTRDEARTDIFRYIEMFYNRKRLHSGLGYKTPESYENWRFGA